MKKFLVAVVAAGVLSFAGATLAQAQGSTDIGLFTAPFRFIVSGKLMPAGNYRVTRQGQDAGMLVIESVDKSAAAFTSTQAVENTYAHDVHVHVQFKAIDGQYFLTEVALPGQDARRIVLTKAAADQMLVKLNLMPAERGDQVSK